MGNFNYSAMARVGRARGRGFVHILVVILAALGLSFWGISEWVLETTDIEQEGEAEKAAGLHEARRALMEYALHAPPRLRAGNRAGSFSALAVDGADSVATPYRYFSLPCPDVGADGNWDGVSDSLYADAVLGTVSVSLQGCGGLTVSVGGPLSASGYQPNVRGGRTGRFPWRTFHGRLGDDFAYVHGAGNRDIVDDFGHRLWYVGARNMTREDIALNPHWQMRQEEGWLRLANLHDVSDGGIADFCPSFTASGRCEIETLVFDALSDHDFGRVAAVAVAPGVSGPYSGGARVPESANITDTAVMSPTIQFAYLEDTTRLHLGGYVANTVPAGEVFNFTVSPLIVYVPDAEDDSTDTISYFTIDDLAAAGEDLFADGEGAIGDLLEGRGGHLGVRELLRAHYLRYGYLPAPAAFSRRGAESLQRFAGAPPIDVSVGTATAEVRAGVVGPTVAGTYITVTAALPVRNIGRVYLQAGSQLSALEEDVYGDGLPPYNLALYALDTAFNTRPMEEDVVDELVSVGIYPHENLMGFRQQNLNSRAAVDSPAVRRAGNLFAPLDSRVYMSRRPPLRDVRFVSPQYPVPGSTLYAALAEPALAYILSTTGGGLQGRVALAEDDDAISDTPPYGVQVKLPPGTRFTLVADPGISVSVFLPPSRVELSEAIYDRASGRWELLEQLSQPAVVADNSDRFITVAAVLSSLAVDSANVGFLPVAGGEARHFDIKSVVSLAIATVGLPGGGANITAAGGVLLPYTQAVSHLPVDMEFFTNGRLMIVPFPPAGRPAAVRSVLSVFSETAASTLAVPSALFINFAGYSATAGTTFVLPAGAQIYYPPQSKFNLGDSFAFPAGTRAFLPPGTEITAQVLPGSNLPGGAQVQNTEIEARAVTLVHGAMMELSGLANLPGNPTATPPTPDIPGGLTIGARVVLDDGFGVNYPQEMFDIELQTAYEVTDETGTVAVFDGGDVLQPLLGRVASDSIAPMELAGTLRFHTWTRTRFLTRGRNLPLRGALARDGIVIVNPADFVHPTLSVPEITTTITTDFIGNVPLPGGRSVAVTLLARAAEAEGTDLRTVDLQINEQTHFMLPPGDYAVTSLFSTMAYSTDAGEEMLASTFRFPEGTAIYDPNIPEAILADLTLAGGVEGYAVLASAVRVSTVTRVIGGGAAVHQIVMMPDSDVLMLNNGATVPAGSMIDAVRGFAWPPGSIWTMPGAATDLAATSERGIYLYFPTAVTLTNRAAHVLGDTYIGAAPGSTLTLVRIGLTTVLSPPEETRAIATRTEEAPDEFALHYAESREGWLDGTATVGMYRENTATAVLLNDSLALPAGTFIILPPGGTLNYLSPVAHTSVGVEESEYVFLPENAVAVLPVGEQVVVGTLDTSGNTMTLALGSETGNRSPPQIRLGDIGGRGLAMISHPDFMQTAPMVFYEGDTFLFDAEGPTGERSNVVSRIDGGTRGDIFGNITRREGLHFAAELLPSDTASFLQNFPMVYAVAEDCRAGYADGGGDCAEEEGEGLEFAVEDGEEVVLEEEMIAGGNIFVRLHSEIDSSASLSLNIYGLDVYYGATGTANSTMAAGVGVAADGAATVYGSSMAGQVSTVLEISAPVNAPADAELRVYTNLTAAVADVAADLSLLDGAHYAILQTATVYAGGFTEGVAGRDILTLTARFGGDGVSNLQLGYGAQVGGDIRGGFPFGADSVIEQPLSAGGTPVRIPLERYSVVNGPGMQFRISISPASRYAELDSAGGILLTADIGERIEVSGASAAASARPAEITLDTSSSIPMEQGYLWQGYMDASTVEVSLLMSTSAALEAGNVLVREAYLRVHPADELLSFWGNGLERAEGMDNRSIARHPPVDMIDVFTFDFTDWTSPERDAPARRPLLGLDEPDDMQRIRITVDASLGGGEYLYNRLWRFGWRSPLIVGGDTAMMYVRVRDANTGEVLEDNFQASWVPRARANHPIRSDNHASFFNFEPQRGFLSYGGPNSAPFEVLDQAYMSNVQEIWAHRRMVGIQRVFGDSVSTYFPVPVNEDSLLEMTLNGVELTATLNIPAFQMRGRALRPSPAWEYDMRSADVRAIATPVEERGDCVPPSHVRTPAVLLGTFPDTIRYGAPSTPPILPISSSYCRNLLPAFSGRLRRESLLTPIYENPGMVTLTLTTAQMGAMPVSDDIPITLIPRPETRFGLPRNPSSTPDAAEVRAVTTNPPGEYNPSLGNVLVVTLENPASYTTSGQRIEQTMILEGGAPSSIGLHDTRVTVPNVGAISTRLHGDLVFYMDRAYSPIGELPTISASPEGGIPAQNLSLGANFRISGPAALVPHFGGRRLDSTADAYAARARLFYGWFGEDTDGTPDGNNDDDRFLLHRRYSAGGYECQAGDNLDTGAGPTCPQMQNRNNLALWVPTIAGAVAFEAAEVAVTANSAAALDDVELAVVLPQPQAVVALSTGGMATIYAGSIIYPRQGVVIPSQRITAASRLEVPDGAVAAVDVSPVHTPKPVRRIREGALFQAWDMHMTPQRVGSVIIEPLRFDQGRLVNFMNFRVNDLTNRNLEEGGNSHFELFSPRAPRNCSYARDITGCRFMHYGGLGGTSGDVTQMHTVGYFISDITLRYDGTMTRGFLMNPRVANVMGRYYNGEDIWVRDHLFTTWFPRRGYNVATAYGARTTNQKFGTWGPHVNAMPTDYNPPVGNESAQVGNPLSWHWLHRRAEGSFIPMGGARQFAFGGNYYIPYSTFSGGAAFNGNNHGSLAGQFPIPAAGLIRYQNLLGVPVRPTRDGPATGNISFRCGFRDRLRYPAAFPDYPFPRDVFFTDVPCIGQREKRADAFSPGATERHVDRDDDRADADFNPNAPGDAAVYAQRIGHFAPLAYYHVGVLSGSDAIAANSRMTVRGGIAEQDDDEFFALRLPHLIDIPPDGTMSVYAHSAEIPYPRAAEHFFEFPAESIANILQVDAASWESVHPHAARYLPGAILSNDGGIYPPAILPIATDADEATDDTRRYLAAAEQLEIQEDNDGHRRVNIGGRRVMHYAKTETQPGAYTYSNTEVYTNVWIRLPRGGRLVSGGDPSATPPVPPDIIHLPPDTVLNPILGTYLPGAALPSPPIYSNYQAFADVEMGSPLLVSRPALVIPRGATVRVGEGGGTITNVKAAAIFSLLPLDNVSCPFGGVSSSLPADGLSAATLSIDQMREGVSDNRVIPATHGVEFTLGHPCAWLDDSENTDGDRFFVYRSRRRYATDNRVRIISNDRTYLFGGRLMLS